MLEHGRMEWEKVGLVIRPDRKLWWARSHAMVPVPEQLQGSLYKIYFSSRDKNNRSHIGFAVLDLLKPEQIIDFSSEPVLAPGELGCFDDNGVTPSCIINANGRKLLYYIGWNPGSTVRVHLFGGLAISDDGGATFTRYSRAPILERTRVDPFLNTAPNVVREDGIWRMYYVAGTGWAHKDLPRYHIKYASSRDGLQWQRDGHVCIDFASAAENALARPWVIKEGGIYKMWFAHKGEAYRIGYAESADGINWQRNDTLAGISVSPAGWDSEMIEYAAVVDYQGRKFMFYNGNNYGFDGIGLALQR